MTETTITVDDGGLSRRPDHYLALAWHVAQANPAPFGDKDAGRFTEHIAREIVRRWLRGVEPELWHNQGAHHSQHHLSRFAKFDGETWIAKTEDDGNDVVHLAIYGDNLPVVCKRPTGKRTTWGADVTCADCLAAVKQKNGATS
jgi:hypothetical protein